MGWLLTGLPLRSFMARCSHASLDPGEPMGAGPGALGVGGVRAR